LAGQLACGTDASLFQDVRRLEIHGLGADAGSPSRTLVQQAADEAMHHVLFGSVRSLREKNEGKTRPEEQLSTKFFDGFRTSIEALPYFYWTQK
jgi:hypothetical protein